MVAELFLNKNIEILTNKGFIRMDSLNENYLLANIDLNTSNLLGFNKINYIKEINLSCKSFTLRSNTGYITLLDSQELPIAYGKSSRGKNLIFKVLSCCNKIANKEVILNQIRLLSKINIPNSQNKQIFSLGQLIGMYIGDGYVVNRKIHFRFKKQRKIDYLISCLNNLNINFKHLKYSDNVSMIYLTDNLELQEKIYTVCGCSVKEKEIGCWDTNIYVGIYDGLKNSDGTAHRNTWVYSTSSNKLKEDFIKFSALAGLNISEYKSQKEGTHHRLKILQDTTIMLNDSRTKEKFVEINPYLTLSGILLGNTNTGVLIKNKGMYLILKPNSYSQ